MNARTMLAIAGMLTVTFTGAVRAEEVATPLVPRAKTTSETPVLVESLKLKAAVFSQTYYRRGDEIVLQLNVDPRTAAVNADFSAVDSQFRPAALRVEVTGRTERVIRYRLSQGNTRKAGTYRVAVHLEPAAGGPTVTRKFPVEYLPGGPGELTAPTGSFVAGQLPRRERQREMSVVAALWQDGQAPVKNRIDPIKPVELSLVLSSPRRLSPNSLKLELAEARGDAFWRVPIRLTSERCTPAGCQYQALTSLDLGPAGGGDGTRTPALAGQLVTSGGAAVPFDLPGFGKTSRPSSPTHRISGTLRFQYQDRQPAPSPEYTLHPWRAPVQETTLQRPIRYASVRLEDECGHDITSTTTATGAFQFQWTPVNCGIGTVTVSAFSASQKASVAYWLNEPIDSPGDLTGDGDDYRAYTWSFTFNTATAASAAGGLNASRLISTNATAARAFYILDNVMIARAYYDSLPGISMYFEAPTIGVVYSPGLKPNDLNCNVEEWDPSGYLVTAFYSPGKHEGFIYIPAEDGCDLGWDAHAIIHETSHLFQRHFLRGGEDIDYGRFGEGLANLQAAVIRGTKWIPGAAYDQLEDLDVNSRMACWKNGVLVADKIDGPNSRQGCLDEGGTVGFPLPVLWDDSTASAGWFQQVVWDLVDESDDLASEPLVTLVPEGFVPEDCGAGACSIGSFDLVNGGGGDGEVLPSSAALNDVLIYYLGGSKAFGTNPNYQDRGLDGLDLVDLFDGMVCRGHATLEQIQTLYGTMGFTYDGLGPATCPHPMD